MRFAALSIVVLLGICSIHQLAAPPAAMTKPTDKLPGKVTEQQLEQLAKGMTEKQVIAKLGIPRAKYKSTLFYVQGDATVEVYFNGGKYTHHVLTGRAA